ncbi:hypothetical protein DEO72_LG3g2315 [Vigna unguiculata]|uniref:Uncharacterized protein n=1 Tax=Vigna unguiculata TaxID=3917 RepID=A0A4D6LHG7_VIGUN|nr:hypothetical protein DEO72_LG3g2315 [Vigna unguiculata]
MIDVLMQRLAAERDLPGNRYKNSGLLERVRLAARVVPPGDDYNVSVSEVLRDWRYASPTRRFENRVRLVPRVLCQAICLGQR